MPYSAHDVVMVVAAGTAAAVMILGPAQVHFTLKDRGKGFGPLTAKIVGTYLFIPALLIVSILGTFASETLVALWGAVAGYVLSQSENKSGPVSRKKPQPQKAAQIDK